MEEGRFVLEREANGRRQISRELQLSALKGLGGSLFAGVRRKVRWTDKPRLGSAMWMDLGSSMTEARFVFKVRSLNESRMRTFDEFKVKSLKSNYKPVNPPNLSLTTKDKTQLQSTKQIHTRDQSQSHNQTWFNRRQSKVHFDCRQLVSRSAATSSFWSSEIVFSCFPLSVPPSEKEETATRKKRSQRDDEEEGKNVTKKLEKSVVSNESQFLFIIFVSCRSLSRSSFFFLSSNQLLRFRSAKLENRQAERHNTHNVGPRSFSWNRTGRKEARKEKQLASDFTSIPSRAELGEFLVL